MAQIDLEKAENVKRNIEHLLDCTDLTWEGLQEGVGLSQSTIRRIKNKLTNLSKSNKNQILEFFGIQDQELDSDNTVILPEIKNTVPYLKFKKDGKANPRYFKSKAKDLKAAKFVRDQILKSNFFNEPRKLSEILYKLKNSKGYKESFSESALSKEIERLFKEDHILEVKDPNENKAYYLYFKVKSDS